MSRQQFSHANQYVDTNNGNEYPSRYIQTNNHLSYSATQYDDVEDFTYDQDEIGEYMRDIWMEHTFENVSVSSPSPSGPSQDHVTGSLYQSLRQQQYDEIDAHEDEHYLSQCIENDAVYSQTPEYDSYIQTNNIGPMEPGPYYGNGKPYHCQ